MQSIEQSCLSHVRLRVYVWPCLTAMLKKMYLCRERSFLQEVDGMSDSLNEKQDANLQKKEERIKRMRNWLGVKETSSLGGYADDSGGVVYGDGHSGWNR